LGGAGDLNRRGEFATVISYQSDRYTATVRTERGRTIEGVPRLRSSPGEVVALAPGSEVLISHDYGIPVILGVLTIPQRGNTTADALPVSEISDVGGNSVEGASEITNNGNYRLAGEPRDVIPGDWVQRGELGNQLAVLGGGTTILRGGPLSQVRAHLIEDLVEVIARNYRQVTDMGEFSITNNNGRTNLRFRGGSTQSTETGSDAERWTIKLDLGSEGDLFNFELCTPEGQTLFQLKVDGSGACEIFGVNGVAINSASRDGGANTEEHDADSSRTVEGDRTSTTRGAESRNIRGNATVDVGSNYSLTCGNDVSITSVRDTSIGAGRRMSISAQGELTSPTGAAMTFDVVSGSWVANVGNITSPLGNFEVTTQTGNVSLKSVLGGNIEAETLLGNIKTTSQSIKLITSLPDSVVLGGESLVSHVVKFEELQQHLTQLYALYDAHTHNLASGATLIPNALISPVLSGDIQRLKSLFVGVAG
jgi:hypothetical protein